MSVEQQLEALFNTGDPSLQDLATRANDLKKALESGQISKGEFMEMLEDLAHEKNINESAHDLQVKIAVNAALEALVNVASMY
jgi:hypothetical protein